MSNISWKLYDHLQMSKTVALALNNALMNALKKETELGPTKPIVGFLR